ncbi:ATP-binding protein [Petroclostridium sp. X23]|uniref:ATP-binding protein n=1 Tax=Petroclostridium sp. X23 TaxID=3045146 RepID=UPI0024AE6FFB|nr:ATP-binding protein [Petroclostridium sp. X23]WHH60857.1 ATP-binding protein [Petroclostridium sp. X23]
MDFPAVIKKVMNKIPDKLQAVHWKLFLVNMINKRNVIVVTIIVLIIALFSRIGYKNYVDYRDEVIAQQMKHLLTIVRSISTSLEMFIGERSNDLKIIANNPKLQEKLATHNNYHYLSSDFDELDALYKVQSGIMNAVYVYNASGIVIYRESAENEGARVREDNVSTPDVVTVLATHKPYISKAYKNGIGKFIIDIMEPVFYQHQFVGVIVASIDLEYMYAQLVEPVKAGEHGYALVKDNQGVILMHPVKEQIGAQVIETREEMYSSVDLSELEEMVREQLKGKEGTAIYHSYWWPEEKLVRVKKMNAYTPAHIDNDFWIVSVVMAYDEIEGPIKQKLSSGLKVASIVVLAFFIVFYIAFRIQKKKEALELETKYLKELNHASQELHRKEMQLMHSQKLQTIGTLTGGIAHEFNNFLTPILGYSELMMKDLPEESDLHENATEILEASKKAKDLIEEILIFSRKETGSLQYKPIQINRLVKDSLKFATSILPPTINIIDDIAEDDVYVLASSRQIHQVIVNLCTNAYHAMKETGGLLKISTKSIRASIDPSLKQKDVPGEVYVKISIQDTGCGMNDKTMAHIFDPFFTTKEIGNGTGLGLFVVHGIISNHNGEITVESQEGKGSIFNIYLPQTTMCEEDGQIPFEEKIKGDKTILLVDDEPKITKMMQKKLTKLGYHVISKTNSMEALTVLTENPEKFDLVISDQSMPGLKGTDLARKVKEIGMDIKFILFTGFVDTDCETLTKEKIIDALLTKPILTNELVSTIEKVFLKYS